MPAYPAVSDPGTNSVAPPNDWASKLLATLAVHSDTNGNLVAAFAKLGTNPAATGVVRIPNAGWITGRNAANSADINLIRVNSGNLCELQGPVSLLLGGATAGDSLNITGGNAPGAALTNKALSMSWLQQDLGNPAVGYAPVNLIQQSVRTTGSAGTPYATFYTTTQHGSGGAAAMGTPIGQANNNIVIGNGDANNEPCAYFGVLNSEIGTGFTQTTGPAGRYWFTDWSMYGPIAVQPGLLNGITMLINNHYSGSPSSSPAAGMWIVTKAGAGGALDGVHSAATTYAVDVGLGISGIASAATTAGFTTGIQLGGTGSGWGTASSRFENAITIADYNAFGIKLTGKFAGSTATAISVSSTAGPVVIGGTAPVTYASALMEVQPTGSDATNPFVAFGRAANNDSFFLMMRNLTGVNKIGVAGATNAFVTGTATGDLVLVPFSSGNKVHIGGTSSVIAVKQDNTLSFFNGTTVAQQAGTGETVGFTAGGGTTVTDASTFTGNVGTKAYRISDIVKALKNYGLLAAS